MGRLGNLAIPGRGALGGVASSSMVSVSIVKVGARSPETASPRDEEGRESNGSLSPPGVSSDSREFSPSEFDSKDSSSPHTFDSTGFAPREATIGLGRAAFLRMVSDSGESG